MCLQMGKKKKKQRSFRKLRLVFCLYAKIHIWTDINFHLSFQFPLETQHCGILSIEFWNEVGMVVMKLHANFHLMIRHAYRAGILNFSIKYLYEGQIRPQSFIKILCMDHGNKAMQNAPQVQKCINYN